MTEAELRQSIKDAAEAAGWLVLRLEEAVGWGRPGTKGLPDLVCMRKGRTVWLEVKTTNKRSVLRLDQRARHEEMRAAGARVEVVRSVETAMEILSAAV